MHVHTGTKMCRHHMACRDSLYVSLYVSLVTTLGQQRVPVASRLTSIIVSAEARFSCPADHQWVQYTAALAPQAIGSVLTRCPAAGCTY